jgi:hypothetical protein
MYILIKKDSTIDVSSTAKFRKVSGSSFSHTPRRGIIDDK